MRRTHNQGQLKLTKLSEAEDIESYLTTFERMMQVQEDKWAFRLAPHDQLTGRAQQAYAAMNGENAMEYRKVKTPLLK